MPGEFVGPLESSVYENNDPMRDIDDSRSSRDTRDAHFSVPFAPLPHRGSAAETPGDYTELLALRSLDVVYRGQRGEFHAVRDVDLSIGVGEQVALVGESGSGKTTLGMAIAGYLGKQTGAEVTFESLVFEGSNLQRKRTTGIPVRTPGIAMIFQDAMTSLDPVWTIGSQLRRVVASTGQEKGRKAVTERARAWLADVGLNDTDRVMKSRPHELSGGMRQRAMMAIALSGSPRLLIADEPTSALDASLSRAAMELMRSLADETGTALLIVSHDVKLCGEFADRMVVMYRGEVVESGAASTLTSHAVHPYTRGLLACVPDLESRHLERLPVLGDFVLPASSALVEERSA